MEKPVIRVIIADDSQVVRTGLKIWLEKDPTISVIDEAGGGKMALSLVKKLEPDVLLIDMSMPDLNGLEVVELLRSEERPVHIVAMTAHTKRFFKEVLQSNISGFVPKEAEPETFILAIKRAAQGRPWFDPEELLKEMKRQSNIESLGLTPTELRVVKWVEYSRKEIAEMLDMSEGVVRTHLYNVYSKLNVNSQLEAIRKARNFDLL